MVPNARCLHVVRVDVTQEFELINQSKTCLIGWQHISDYVVSTLGDLSAIADITFGLLVTGEKPDVQVFNPDPGKKDAPRRL